MGKNPGLTGEHLPDMLGRRLFPAFNLLWIGFNPADEVNPDFFNPPAADKGLIPRPLGRLEFSD